MLTAGSSGKLTLDPRLIAFPDDTSFESMIIEPEDSAFNYLPPAILYDLYGPQILVDPIIDLGAATKAPKQTAKSSRRNAPLVN